MTPDRGAEPRIATNPPPTMPAVGLVFRFLLELALLIGLGYWGWHLGDGRLAGGALAVVLPAVAAALWGVFAVRGDPSRGTPIVAIPGALRLGLELVLFGLAGYGLWISGSRAAAETLFTAVGIHYALSWERMVWLLRH